MSPKEVVVHVYKLNTVLVRASGLRENKVAEKEDEEPTYVGKSMYIVSYPFVSLQQHEEVRYAPQMRSRLTSKEVNEDADHTSPESKINIFRTINLVNSGKPKVHKRVLI